MKTKRNAVKARKAMVQNGTDANILVGTFIGAAITACVLLITTLLTGCGDSPGLERVVETRTETVTLPALAVDEVAQVLQQKNDYRLAAGQAPLVAGLVCSLHVVPNTTTVIPNSLPAASATWVYEGSFNVEDSNASSGLPIVPASIRAVYTSWYIVRCSGNLIVTRSGYHTLLTTTDDGSMLYINNSLMVDNNGLHSSQTRNGVRLLERGIHTFRLDYLQATGQQSLIVSDQDGIISGNRFVR